MSERISPQELQLYDDFDRFVDEHAATALLWVVVDRGRRKADSYIDHVEFETERHNRQGWNPPPGAGAERFMDIYVSTSMRDDEPLSVEHFKDRNFKIIDEKEELGIISGIANANRRRHHPRAVSSLLDQLLVLEATGHFVPAYQRKYGFVI